MRIKLLVQLMVLSVLAAGCATHTVPTSPESGPSQAPTRVLATPTLDVLTPQQIGQSFLEAWQISDYAKMYTLLTPELRQGLTLDDFQAAYTGPLHTTTTISVTILPRTLSVENGSAWIDFQEIWHTALFGDLQASNRLDLLRSNDQWWVDWHVGSVWPDLSQGRRFGIEYQIPPRANIYDMDGAGLAVPATIVTVGVVPARIENENQVLNALAQALEMNPEAIRQRYAGQPAEWFIPIGDLDSETSLAYDEMLSLPGIERREKPGRLYPMKGVGAHVVGWVSPIPAEEYEAYHRLGYRGDERVGIAGVEGWGERILAGQNGASLYLVGPDGSYLGRLAERPASRGRAIYTTLERDLQALVEQVLGARRGAVVAIDIHTGAVRALTSGPTFDNNVFVRPTADGERQAVLYDPNRPLLNRATLGQYPLGSVFKIVTMAAGLGPGSMTAQTPFHCPGYWDGLGIANRKFCWLRSGHGDINLQQGLTASCNVVFYEVGARLHAIDPMILPTYARSFGLGVETGLEALSEAAGLVPDPDWKWATYQEHWGTGDTVNMAIGQGFLLVTPVQIARMMAAIANGGTLYQPYLVARIAGDEQHPEQVTQPKVVGQLPVSAEHLAVIQQALLGVTSDPELGTATHRFRGLEIPVAGKTGTAQSAQEGALPHSWFAGYFPANDPELAVVVIVENAGEGSTVAAPMFRQIVEGYYGLPLTPLPTPSPSP